MRSRLQPQHPIYTARPRTQAARSRLTKIERQVLQRLAGPSGAAPGRAVAEQPKRNISLSPLPDAQAGVGASVNQCSGAAPPPSRGASPADGAATQREAGGRRAGGSRAGCGRSGTAEMKTIAVTTPRSAKCSGGASDRISGAAAPPRGRWLAAFRRAERSPRTGPQPSVKPTAGRQEVAKPGAAGAAQPSAVRAGATASPKVGAEPAELAKPSSGAVVE